jgi:hypothetical protein
LKSTFYERQHIHNEKNELIPQQTVTGWWMCIDYQKLNKATQKDHFPLPFIDEMLERPTNHSFCYLDGYSSYHQILIHLDNRARPHSHVHMAFSHTGKCHLDYVMLQHYFKGA